MPWRRVREVLRGPVASPSDRTAELRAVNNSFVLHTPSTHPDVAALVSDQSRHIHRPIQPHDRFSTESATELTAFQPDLVLTAQAGAPIALQNLVTRLPIPPTIVSIDACRDDLVERTLFRAPAQLALPAQEAERLVVAAALVRPGGRSLLLRWHGPFRWPDDELVALSSLAGILRDFLDQWTPSRALWEAPAEVLLPEVLERDPSSPFDSR